VAEAVPSPIGESYAVARLAQALQVLEDTLEAASVSGQAHSVTYRQIAELERVRDYWAMRLNTIRRRAGGQTGAPLNARVAGFGGS
jgi:hypothetical protein